MENNNPFDKFIVDENVPIDKNLVVEIVQPFIESIGKNKIIKFTDKFDKSLSRIKILIYLCTRKIMNDQKIVEDEKVGPKEISEDTGIDQNTAKNISRDKILQKFVSKEGNKYFVKNCDLKKVKGMIENDKRKTIKKRN